MCPHQPRWPGWPWWCWAWRSTKARSDPYDDRVRTGDGIDPATIEPPIEDSGLFYGADLAYVHDRAFGHVARAGGLTLIRFLGRHRCGEGLVVELGWGSVITAPLLA